MQNCVLKSQLMQLESVHCRQVLLKRAVPDEQSKHCNVYTVTVVLVWLTWEDVRLQAAQLVLHWIHLLLFRW